jgi:predicted RNA-binding protein (virulence factor B family)
MRSGHGECGHVHDDRAEAGAAVDVGLPRAALVADVIRRRHGSLPSAGEIIARVTRGDDQIDAP